MPQCCRKKIKTATFQSFISRYDCNLSNTIAYKFKHDLYNNDTGTISIANI